MVTHETHGLFTATRRGKWKRSESSWPQEHWPHDRNDMSKSNKRKHVHFWEAIISNVLGHVPGPRQICWTGPEMGPHKVTGKAFRGLPCVGGFEQ